jgi:hypothetical protein
MNTYNDGMLHYTSWLNKLGGNYKYTAPYTIDKSGQVYQHYNPDYYSKIFNKTIDSSIIGILMVNNGYLERDNATGKYITWLGDIYNGDDVIERRWRGHKYWQPYTDEQYASALLLTRHLCDKYTIGNNVVPNNIMLESPNTFTGVMYKSNFGKQYSDLSPAWDFQKFKNDMEHGY